MNYKSVIGLMCLFLIASAQINSPSDWTKSSLPSLEQTFVKSAQSQYNNAILDYDLTVWARAGGYIDDDGEDAKKFYIDVLNSEGELLSQKTIDHQTGNISVCKTNVKDEYFYVYGATDLYIGFVNARTGQTTRTQQAKLNSATGYTNALCALAGEKMYVLTNFGTPDWNTAVFVIDLSNTSTYSASDVITLDNGGVQTFKYGISGYEDGHAVVFAEKSDGKGDLYKYIFNTKGNNFQSSKVTSGLLTAINGQTKFMSHQDLKSGLSTILYGNTSKLQIFTYDSQGKELCFNTIEKSSKIGAFYNIEFQYIDSNTIYVVNTVAEARQIFLIDPQECKLKYNDVYKTEKVYGYVVPVIKDSQEAVLLLGSADRYDENILMEKLALGVVETEGCEEIELFECVACDGESEMEYFLNEYGICESAIEEDDEDDQDDQENPDYDDDQDWDNGNGNEDSKDEEDGIGNNGSVMVATSMLALVGAVCAALI